MSPIVRLSQPITDAFGKISDPGTNRGLVLFTSARGTRVARQLVSPTNPKSTQQQMARGLFSATAAAYKALSIAEAAAWTELGHSLTKTNMAGGDYSLAGMAAYQLVNNYRQLNGQAITDTAPDSSTMPVPVTSITSATYNDGTAQLIVVVNCTGMANGCLVLLRISDSIARQSRKARLNEVRIPSTTETTAFGTVAANAATVTATVNVPTLAATEYAGISLHPMSATYMPRLTPYFAAQQLLSAP